ncbi:diphosphomevalonate decarboxylase [Amphibacillus marinus]|uniref:diphosphomevalonate decarboxylase n=1 Tax=Amphibacillus marinus TaxID=872970 RepID=A0A1H8K4D3_9BACI|nr:diphosphomevalonate decarboxylase [Amphibacillus marinus]SEN87803.1 diphosphomevalonate decarboxylase [Amphibacillus marinus]
MKAKARAHTNIALIKYWGKRNETLFLPMNSSLSITLDRFYTETSVSFDQEMTKDQFYLNGELATDQEQEKVSVFLSKIRRYTGVDSYARIESDNFVPTSAGFASSASGYAALTAAAVKATGIELSLKQLSMLARQGSGSATRSIYGGFVEWQKGQHEDGSDSFAVPILEQGEWDLRVLAVEVTTQAKKIFSREGMKRTVETSPFYSGWLETIERDLAALKQAIVMRNFTKLGETLEANALKMHATTLGATPPFMYWQSETFQVMEVIQELREDGIEAYFTIDAGPNVKVICEPRNESVIIDKLTQIDTVNHIYTCRVGPGITYLDR